MKQVPLEGKQQYGQSLLAQTRQAPLPRRAQTNLRGCWAGEQGPEAGAKVQVSSRWGGPAGTRRSFFELQATSQRAPPLSPPDGLAAFRAFLLTEFSEENLEFWLACEEFKKAKSQSKMASKAKKIFAEFIAIQSFKEVSEGIAWLGESSAVPLGRAGLPVPTDSLLSLARKSGEEGPT